MASLQGPRGTAAIKSAGVVFTRRALLLRVAAACFVALAASVTSLKSQDRRFRDLANVWLKT